MKRRTFLSMLAAVAAMIFAISGSASAQGPCPPECTYRVNVDCNIPPGCLPLWVMTKWHCLTDIETLTIPIKQCGKYDFKKPGPCEPVPCDLEWVSLDGGQTQAFPNGPGVTFFCNDGTQMCLTLKLLPDGCSVINITAGPC